jgi:hypothetical protein
MKKINLLTIVLILTSLISCKQKLTCDDEKAIKLIKIDVKADIIEAWALKLAAENFQDDITKDNYHGSKYDWVDNMTTTYRKYLLENLQAIKTRDGFYYEEAVKQYSENEVMLENIITEKYDESIDKCECTSEIILTNTDSKNNVKFDVVRNSEGEVTGHYIYRPKAMLDEKTNASDFIKRYKDKYE